MLAVGIPLASRLNREKVLGSGPEEPVNPQRLSAGSPLTLLNKLQRGGIHTVPQVGGLGAVIKNMSEVCFAFRAGNGGAAHVQTAVARSPHIFLRNRSPETRPTGP